MTDDRKKKQLLTDAINYSVEQGYWLLDFDSEEMQATIFGPVIMGKEGDKFDLARMRVVIGLDDEDEVRIVHLARMD